MELFSAGRVSPRRNVIVIEPYNLNPPLSLRLFVNYIIKINDKAVGIVVFGRSPAKSADYMRHIFVFQIYCILLPFSAKLDRPD
jgi:hypothetical protein